MAFTVIACPDTRAVQNSKDRNPQTVKVRMLRSKNN
jgi:hypothetical protein